MTSKFQVSRAASSKSIGLEVWMDRVLETAERIHPEWNTGDVHALRVAFRRSRTMAEALSEVNPVLQWRKIKKASRPVFHALGALRDTQVERSWVKKLGPPRDPVRMHMLRFFSRQEKEQRKIAKSAVKHFDRKNWRKWKRKLVPEAAFFPMESVVFQRIALSRLNSAWQLYERARKSRSGVAWHRVRIGLKRFRYVVENFLPRRYEVWEKDLKRFQDLLGEVHDLDVLRTSVKAQTAKLDPRVVASWMERIESERKARLKEFQERSSLAESPWSVWRSGFQLGRPLVAMPFPQRRTA
jgi:CHAD domain-containing protein